MRIELTTDFLQTEYIDNDKSSQQIADETGYEVSWIRKKLKSLNIVKDKIVKKTNYKDIEFDKSMFYDLYMNQNFSLRVISKILKVHEVVLQRYIKKNNIVKDECLKKMCKKDINTKHDLLTTQNVEKYYIKENKTIPEVSKILNIPISTLTLFIKKHGLSKNKDVIETQRNINRKRTILQKYGVEYAIQNKEIKGKKDQTNLKKYGTTAPSSTPEVIAKIRKTKIEKYGTYNTSSLDSIKEKMKKTCLERYGVEYSCMAKHCREASHKIISQINKRWANRLKCEEFEIQIGLYSFDMKKDNILIEVNPTVTHNSTIGPVWFKDSKPKEKNYHQTKLNIALENNYDCFMIWDWDDEEKIINFFKSRKKIFARETEIKEVSEKDCNEFLIQNHFQGTCKGQDIRLGLYKDNQLLEIMTFGKPRYNKDCQWELLRLCTKPEVLVVGGASKLFKHFTDNYNPESIISYCDLSKFSGKVYENLGMVKINKERPSCHWFNIRTNQHITNNLLRQRGADQLLGTKDGKGTSNKEIMIREGFVEVYDCGQATYIWKA